jgi:hypothetical protein
MLLGDMTGRSRAKLRPGSSLECLSEVVLGLRWSEYPFGPFGTPGGSPAKEPFLDGGGLRIVGLPGLAYCSTVSYEGDGGVLSLPYLARPAAAQAGDFVSREDYCRATRVVSCASSYSSRLVQVRLRMSGHEEDYGSVSKYTRGEGAVALVLVVS